MPIYFDKGILDRDLLPLEVPHKEADGIYKPVCFKENKWKT